ncbi:site-specific recombinase XerD [Chitinophaga terrae (ex Kim and Jung 2007)]|uniref:site-specific integrase n=1 Tax=Chitinophaga terrae (ex Kim and Jung 2007) TaxID=408074 RepID=UPI00278A2C95|nr:site-specific integrase [Chitinophaga terrae (ex Kim and Jung 2007)]MDQ0109156.1 site-specific recombinase XerD [Chitinophaga terrae (ex Kim and Jung 2007)]
MKVSQELSILFHLRYDNNNSDGKATICVRLTVTGFPRDGFSLGYKVEPSKFNKEAGIIIGKSAEAIEINRYLQHVKSELIRHYNQLKALDPVVTATMIKNSYNGINREKRTLLELVDFHNEKFQQKVDKEKRKASTMKKWRSTKDKLSTFIASVFKAKDIPLGKIDYAFAEDFFDYLTLTDGLRDNSAMKYIKNTKQLMKLAVRRKWINANPIEDFVCSYINPERDILTVDELRTMYSKEFSIPRLEEARDAYLFMALTGFAYKDVLLLTRDHLVKFFDGEDWIVKNREKTWCRENVPLLPVAKEILKEYENHPYCVANNVLLPIKSNQRFNGYLKEIADICGINKNLTTHTARHTFATTVTLANGVPLETVSAMLGHKSIRTTQIYAKIVASKVSQDMKSLKASFDLSIPNSLLLSAVA